MAVQIVERTLDPGPAGRSRGEGIPSGAPALLLAALVFLFTACSEEASSGPRPNIVLITLDTLRADHLGCCGYPFGTSPSIDALAEEGVVFESAFSCMATTSPAHASIFTSLYPIQHQVLKNGHRLDGAFTTLAEKMKKIGYRTVGVASTHQHFMKSNLDQGFEIFNDPVLTDVPDEKMKDFIDAGGYRRADKNVDRILEELNGLGRGEKYFLWAHFFDPHDPCLPPNEHLEAVTPGTPAEREAYVQYLLNEQRLDPGVCEGGLEEMVDKVLAYDGEIHFMDAEIGRLVESVEKMGFEGETVWIITTDHGEGLGNHQWFGHGRNVYNELIRVPLIVRFSSGNGGSGGVPADPEARRTDRVVQIVDLLPTILELAGSEAGGQAYPMQGTSLVPLINGGDSESGPGVAFAQRRHFAPRSKKPKAEKGEKFSLQDSDWKYIFWSDGGDEFYNLKDDPFELENLIENDSAVKEKFRTALRRKIEALREGVAIRPKFVSPETIERLKELGYDQ